MEFDSKMLMRFIHEKFPLLKETGIILEQFTREKVQVRLPFVGINKNHLGTMYAGSLFCAAEATGGILVVANFNLMQYITIVRKIVIDYLKKGESDIICTASIDETSVKTLLNSIEEKGRGELEINIILTNSLHEPVSLATGIYGIKRI